MIFIGSKAPVSFFAYPNKKSYLLPDETKTVNLCSPEQDGFLALQALSDECGILAINKNLIQNGIIEIPTTGKLDRISIGPLISGLMPENAIVSDEAATSSLFVTPHTHLWPSLMIGFH